MKVFQQQWKLKKRKNPICCSTPQYGFAASIIESVLQQEMNGEVMLLVDMSFVVIHYSSPYYGENDYSV